MKYDTLFHPLGKCSKSDKKNYDTIEPTELSSFKDGLKESS